MGLGTVLGPKHPGLGCDILSPLEVKVSLGEIFGPKHVRLKAHS